MLKSLGIIEGVKNVGEVEEDDHFDNRDHFRKKLGSPRGRKGIARLRESLVGHTARTAEFDIFHS